MNYSLDPTVWNSGPPPAAGWWPASRVKNPRTFRWWNGEAWSLPVRPSESAASAGRWAAMSATLSPNLIEWRYWDRGRAQP